MKRILVVACVVFVVGACGGKKKPAADPAVGEVTAVTGDVSVLEPPAEPKPATVGMKVLRDMTFKTGDGASVEVRFANHYIWKLGEKMERPIAKLRVIDLPTAEANAATVEDKLADDSPDRTAGAGRLAERNAAETGATAVTAAPGEPSPQVEPAKPPEKTGEHHAETVKRSPPPDVQTETTGESDSDGKMGTKNDKGGGGSYKMKPETDEGGIAPDMPKPTLPPMQPVDDATVVRAKASPMIQKCEATRKGPMHLTLTVSVAADGTITSVKVAGGQPDEDSCVVTEVKSHKLSAGAARTVTVTIDLP